MGFDQILERLRYAVDNRQKGIDSSHVLIIRRDLNELLRDWERLDRIVREGKDNG